jgi:8-oxo-dGTP pyrophosphatase MutT (NUDIX family)
MRDWAVSGLRGDHDLNPGLRPNKPLTRAAVLVPIVERPQSLSVLLTRRTAHLNDHAGQISFPGGRVDAADRDEAAAALREAEEEVGLAPDSVEILARLDTYVTRTGYEVAPFVGLVRPPAAYNPDPFEVAEVFEVPLEFFLRAENRRLDSRVYQGQRRHFHAFPFGEHYIWGATAGMIVNLIEVLSGSGQMMKPPPSGR